MAIDLNQVTMLGRLTKDPELRYTQQGNPVCTFSIANNQGPDQVSFFDIVVWNKQAENCSQYLSKGKLIAITGKLNQRRWQDQNGQARSKIEIVASVVQFLSTGNSTGGYGDYQGPPPDEFSSPPSGGGDYPDESYDAPSAPSAPPQKPKQNEYSRKPDNSNNYNQKQTNNTTEKSPSPPDDFLDDDDDIPF